MSDGDVKEWAKAYNKDVEIMRKRKEWSSLDETLDITPEQLERIRPTQKQLDMEYIAAYKQEKLELGEDMDEDIDHVESIPHCFCLGCRRSVKARLRTKPSHF